MESPLHHLRQDSPGADGDAGQGSAVSVIIGDSHGSGTRQVQLHLLCDEEDGAR